MLKYFGILLEKGQLDHLQSSELARALLQRGRKHLLVKWLNENKVRTFRELQNHLANFLKAYMHGKPW